MKNQGQVKGKSYPAEAASKHNKACKCLKCNYEQRKMAEAWIRL